MVALMALGDDLGPTMSYGGPSTRQIEPDSRQALERMRGSGDLRSQRRHAWNVFVRLTGASTTGARPLFQSWYGEDAVFAKVGGDQAPRGLYGFARGESANERVASGKDNATQAADTPLLTYTLYNEAAYRHIRAHRLHRIGELQRLKNLGPDDASIPGNRSIPAFPADAIVFKTAWWPVAGRGLTALPVWDPESNPPRQAGNAYTSWKRVIAVDPVENADGSRATTVDFAGRTYEGVRRFGLDAFHHVAVDDALAKRLNHDRSARKASLVALGRPFEAGDSLVLVGGNLATKEIDDWVWAAFWWFDRPYESRLGADRTPDPGLQWRGYLLQVAFDSDKPAAFDGGPHVCFNPWLEGRFPDGGHGGGTVSNCMTCHRRASYPPVDFLPVTRGSPNLGDDQAYARGKLRTNFIWSVALHARQ
jgi:hypothetical protein